MTLVERNCVWCLWIDERNLTLFADEINQIEKERTNTPRETQQTTPTNIRFGLIVGLFPWASQNTNNNTQTSGLIYIHFMDDFLIQSSTNNNGR